MQAALKLVLEPIFEADFQPFSYGFRPRRRAQDAIAEIHLFGTTGYQWVLEADIKACFDEIDHTALMDRVRARIKDKRVLALVKAFLKAGILTELGDGKGHLDRHPARRDHSRPQRNGQSGDGHPPCRCRWRVRRRWCRVRGWGCGAGW